MTETTLRRVLPEAYTIGLVGTDNYWAFLEGGAGVICAAYQDGTYIEDVAETGDLPGLVDTRATLVAERYLLVNPKDGSGLYVWDVLENTVASYAAPAGFQIAGAGAAEGTVYWIEWPEQDWGGGPVTYTSTVRLLAAGYTLESPTEVTTAEASDNFYWEWRTDSPAAWFGLSSEAALGSRIAWDVINNEITQAFRVRLPLSGVGGAADGGGSFPEANLSVGVPHPDAGLLFAGQSGPDALLYLQDTVDTDVTVVAQWPTSEEWQLDSGAYCASVVTEDGEAVIYGSDSAAGLTVVRGDLAGGSAPRKRFVVDEHPVALVSPNFVFPRSA